MMHFFRMIKLSRQKGGKDWRDRLKEFSQQKRKPKEAKRPIGVFVKATQNKLKSTKAEERSVCQNNNRKENPIEAEITSRGKYRNIGPVSL